MKTTHYIIALIILLAMPRFAFSLPEDSIVYDNNSHIEIRNVNVVTEYENDSRFDYNREIPKTPNTLWERIMQFIQRLLANMVKTETNRTILYVILGIILAIVIVKLLGLNYQSLILRNKKLKGKIDFETYDEDIHKLNLDDIIQKAIAEGNYRKATRYLYLKLLKNLSDNEIIEWQINKTNREYRKEVSKTKFYKHFHNLTYIYEYVWYGDFEISESKFQPVKNEFNKLFTKLN